MISIIHTAIIFYKYLKRKIIRVNIKNLELEGVLELKPKLFDDERGYLYENYNIKNVISILGEGISFKQQNIVFNKKGVIRGLHFQKPPNEQGKLISVLSGKIFDVVLDIKKNSKTFGKHISIVLDSYKKNILWIPPGYAHGFQSLDEETLVQYNMTEIYNPEFECSINYNDPQLDIDWPIKSDILVSEKDKDAKNLEELA